jgi:autotransporter-associated beta strand protein
MMNQVRLITNDRPSAAATDQSRKVSRGKEKTTIRITPRRGIPRRIDAVITLSLRGVLPAVILLGATVPTCAGYTTINISSYLNGNISTNVSEMPVGLTTGNVGNNIPFQTYPYGSNNYMGTVFLAGSSSPSNLTTVTINLSSYGLIGQQTMYALLNNYYGQLNVNEYNVTINFVGGQSETYQSIGGVDTRDYNYNPGTAQTIANTTANWWTNIAINSPTSFQRLDVREFTVEPQYFALPIASVTLTQVSSDPALLSGLTFSTLAAIPLNNSSTPTTVSNISANSVDNMSALGVTVSPAFDGGTLTNGSSAAYGGDFTVSGNGGTIDAAGQTLTLSGVFSDLTLGVPGQLVILDSGVGGGVVLTGMNTIAGGIQVDAGGLLSIPAGYALGSGPLQLLGTGAGPATLAVTGTTNIANAVQVTGTADWLISPGVVATQSGVISDGTSSGGIEVSGNGALALTAANTYTGPTTIDSGATLAVVGAGSIAASSGVTADGTFDISGASSGVTINSLAGTGAVTLGAQTLALAQAAGTFSGIIGGSGGLAINGGSETLTGANTYTGGTVVTGGATLGAPDSRQWRPAGFGDHVHCTSHHHRRGRRHA